MERLPKSCKDQTDGEDFAFLELQREEVPKEGDVRACGSRKALGSKGGLYTHSTVIQDVDFSGTLERRVER